MSKTGSNFGLGVVSARNSSLISSRLIWASTLTAMPIFIIESLVSQYFFNMESFEPPLVRREDQSYLLVVMMPK